MYEIGIRLSYISNIIKYKDVIESGIVIVINIEKHICIGLFM